ncbi:MarR family transcriptional regulator [Patulibacter sp.]|uniref:MarR family transcriptional regulator n=1 Tax=Patulibacter sp. TaxID=1912859 RepID=UPI00271AB7C7|nr:MarR family transcriptional regulator [Patulibacter sp.]MDO9409744.1 MarR family transcriptional regulator [Patulibacter sp.]
MRTTVTDAPDRSSVPEVAAHLRLVITRTARRLRTEASAGLGPSLGAALATVERWGPLSPSELADREGIRRPSATRIVARLEEEGLVGREPDPDDGRSFRVSLTAQGVEHIRDVRSRKDAFLARRLERLSAEDRATLDRASDLLERLLEDAGDDEPR